MTWQPDKATLYVYVTGPNESGKSTLLSSLGGAENYFIDADLGVEYRLFDIDEELALCVLTPLDGTRFDPLLQINPRDLLGYILVVDSTQFDSWSLARVMLANCRGYALLPTVIAANKQDLQGAFTPEQLGAWIGMDSMMRVQGVVATRFDSARDLFLQLLYAIKSEMDQLDTLISKIEDLLANDPDSGS